MRAIAADGETGIGTATTVGARDKVATSADSNFKKRVDIFCQDEENWVVSQGDVRGRGLR